MTAAIPDYVNIEPHLWRSVLARAAIFHAARTRLSDLSESALPEIEGALADLRVYATAYASEDIDAETAVAKVVAAWDRSLTAKMDLPALDEAARALLSTVKGLIGGVTGADDPILQIFEVVTARASSVYGTAWRSPTLKLSHIARHPRGDVGRSDPYALTAKTPSPGANGASAVELILCCEAFGPAAYAVVPLVLIHECICHVPARQDLVKNDSPFAEGLLDWVAYEFLNKWAKNIDEGLSAAARTHGRALRSVLAQHTTTAEGRARQLGHHGAETLVNWFEQELDCDYAEATARVCSLAVDLNTVDCSLLTKDLFVSRLEMPLPDDLQQGLRDWLNRRLSAAGLFEMAAAS